MQLCHREWKVCMPKYFLLGLVSQRRIRHAARKKKKSVLHGIHMHASLLGTIDCECQFMLSTIDVYPNKYHKVGTGLLPLELRVVNEYLDGHVLSRFSQAGLSSCRRWAGQRQRFPNFGMHNFPRDSAQGSCMLNLRASARYDASYSR